MKRSVHYEFTTDEVRVLREALKAYVKEKMSHPCWMDRDAEDVHNAENIIYGTEADV